MIVEPCQGIQEKLANPKRESKDHDTLNRSQSKRAMNGPEP